MPVSLVELTLLLPVVGGTLFSLITLWASARLAARLRAHRAPAPPVWPPVTILKPCFGLDRDLDVNLRSACEQDYAEYQVVIAVQRLSDPALPTIRAVADSFGPERVTVVALDCEPAANGKVQNLINAERAARHDLLVISDSDVRLPPDYLRSIVGPFADPVVGSACTYYRAVGARRWFERLELLTLNADFSVNLMFADVTGAADFCVGSSLAFRRSVLREIGGFEALSDSFVEDYVMGRMIRGRGYRTVMVPYFVDIVVDLASPRQWWNHQLYWDQTTRAVRPLGFFFTVFTRAVPFALLFAVLRLFDPLGLAVLAVAVASRLGVAWIIARFLLDDRETARSICWLPLRDIAALVSWAAAFARRTIVWRGRAFDISRDGRLVPREAAP